jgi:Na+/H+ antiporter NhaC
MQGWLGVLVGVLVTVEVLVFVMVGVRVEIVTIKGVTVSVAVGVVVGNTMGVAVLFQPGSVGGAYKAVWDASTAAVCTMAVPSCSGGITTGAGVVPQANIKPATITRSIVLSLLILLFISHILLYFKSPDPRMKMIYHSLLLLYTFYLGR